MDLWTAIDSVDRRHLLEDPEAVQVSLLAIEPLRRFWKPDQAHQQAQDAGARAPKDDPSPLFCDGGEVHSEQDDHGSFTHVPSCADNCLSVLWIEFTEVIEASDSAPWGREPVEEEYHIQRKLRRLPFWQE